VVPGSHPVRHRITAQIAERTFGVLAGAGVSRIGQARHIPQGAFIGYLDEGGYADARTVARLQHLSGIIDERYDGRAALIGQRFTTYPALRAALDVLPGWRPVPIQLFLRELRGSGLARSRRSTRAPSTRRATSASPASGQTRMFPASPSSPHLTPIPGTSTADWSRSPSRITTGE
jgi:hypothetical protein